MMRLRKLWEKRMKTWKRVVGLCVALLVLCGCVTASDNTSSSSAGTSVLVAYFSGTGNTEKLANTIAEVTGGDLYKITPAEAYTKTDLDHNDDSGRIATEQKDASSRPAIEGEVENFDQYDTIYLGYPIWWADAPHIMFTFAESYDFTGKTIIPFCTSGGSDVGDSDDNIKACANGGTWIEGTKLSAGTSSEKVQAWIDTLELD